MQSLNNNSDNGDKPDDSEDQLKSDNIQIKTDSKEIVEICEDSGFGSVAESAAGAVEDCSELINDSPTVAHLTDAEKFELVVKEREEKRRIRAEEAKQRRLAKENFDAEIEEQQYKRLLHLLSKSKALSTFILRKFDTNDTNKETKQPTRSKKRKNSDIENISPNKKSRNGKLTSAPKKSQSKLDNNEIGDCLASCSDDDSQSEDVTNDWEKFFPLQYFQGTLREYQKIGFNWMRILFENGLSGILADEMGLGKTVQIIALFAYLIEKKVSGPFMIIVPFSTLPNWKSEFKRFAPRLPVVVYHATRKEREGLKPLVIKKYTMSSGFKTQPIVLLTYQTPAYDHHFLKQFCWRYIVIDEGQRIKNTNCQLKRIVQDLSSMNRLLLTGTPLQNNLSELWSLLNFLLPEIFNDLQVFESWFDPKVVQSEEGQKKFFKQEQEKQVIQKLREILAPFMLRRIKEVVCPDIPPMKEVIVYAPLSKLQFELYEGLLRFDMAKYEEEGPDYVEACELNLSGRPKRKCTKPIKFNQDPADQSENSQLPVTDDEKAMEKLLLLVPYPVTSNKTVVQLEQWRKHVKLTAQNVAYFLGFKVQTLLPAYRHVVNHPYILYHPYLQYGCTLSNDDILTKSGKLLVLDEMLTRLHANNHKVLLFSSMKLVLNILEDYLSLRAFNYVRLDGDTSLQDRDRDIYEFNNNPKMFLFLITTRAGAVGLNLAAADTVIIYDSDWNPQMDLQAMARCHRIGQTRPVVAYRLCTKGTIDEEIVKRAQMKRFLEKAVISKKHLDFEGVKRLQKMLETNEVKVITSKNNKIYTETEWDAILSRSDLFSQYNDTLEQLKDQKIKK